KKKSCPQSKIQNLKSKINMSYQPSLFSLFSLPYSFAPLRVFAVRLKKSLVRNLKSKIQNPKSKI
ncbi:hypothetical protein QUA81_27010, partial [Microcoleus sp. F6_B4]